MKTLLATLLFFTIYFSLNAQDITNTLAPNGEFKIKDGTTDYFTIKQSNGTINLISPIGGNQGGTIFKGNERFLHTYFTEGTDGFNTFLGINSGNFTLGGSSFQASYNTGVGYLALSSLTIGSYNSAFGHSSLSSNTAGVENSAFGYYSLYSNTSGGLNSAFGYYSLYTNTIGYNNAAFGSQSLYSNTIGYENSAFGLQSLYSNTTGYQNSAFGMQSLISNTTGHYNSAFGFWSLLSNTTGTENSAFGNFSLNSNTTGWQNSAFGTSSLSANTTGYQNSAFGYNSLNDNTTGYQNSTFGHSSLLSNTTGYSNSAFGTSSLAANTTGIYNCSFGFYSLLSNTTGNFNCAFGYNALSNNTTGSNNTAIGNSAVVPSITGSNQVRIGNTSVTYAGIQVGWTITSDRRWKENIEQIPFGLNFISELNPVSYTRMNDESHRTEFGLIAQEVEEVLKEYGEEKTGMLTITDDGMYELRYNDLIAPMIKAIQELSEELHQEKIEKDEKIAALSIKNTNLEERLAKYEEFQMMLVRELEVIKSNQQNYKVQIVKAEDSKQ